MQKMVSVALAVSVLLSLSFTPATSILTTSLRKLSKKGETVSLKTVGRKGSDLKAASRTNFFYKIEFKWTTGALPPPFFARFIITAEPGKLTMLKTDYEGETMEEKEVTLDLTEYGKIAKEVRVRCNKETNSPEKGIKYEHPMGGPVYSLTAYAKGTVLDTYSGKVGDFAMESGCLPDVVEIVKSKFPEETTE